MNKEKSLIIASVLGISGGILLLYGANNFKIGLSSTMGKGCSAPE